jgi:hypothetical protein
MVKHGPMTVKLEAVHQPQFSAKEQEEYLNRYAGFYPSQPMHYTTAAIGETAQV